MQKLRSAAGRYDYLIPWLLLLLVVGATAGALQVLIVKLLR
ncbi:MAG TPA: hypothetical protein VLJ18_01240 [Thermoanaerobaculia bacterium]|nr:hypothetical protein [Thermoanaerobaculia bacterium]